MPIRPGRAKAISFVTGFPLTYTGNGTFESYPYTVVGGLDLITGLPYVNTLFVGKNGSNSNSGTKPTEPLLTIGAATTAAAALAPTEADPVGIIILDSGVYVEAVTLPDYVSLLGLTAVVGGVIVVGDGSSVLLERLVSVADSSVLLRKPVGNTGISYARIVEIDGRPNSGVALAGNLAAEGVLFVATGRAFVGTSGIGFGDALGGFGHMHVDVEDLYLAGDTCIGIFGNLADSSILVRGGHILEIGTPTGTTAISVSSTGSVYVDLRQTIADTAYTITGAGNLYLICPDVQGTRTGAPALEISSDRLVAPNLPTAAAGLPSGAIWNNSGVLNIVP